MIVLQKDLFTIWQPLNEAIGLVELCSTKKNPDKVKAIRGTIFEMLLSESLQ